MAEQRSAYTDHEDLWLSLRLLWRLLRQDDPVQQLEGKPYASLLGLPVLNGELFDPLTVDHCRLINSVLLEGFWHLAFYRESSSSPPQKVNYAALDVEELGSVYESLLEFHPAVDPDASGRLRFELVPGSERKTTGSYYTSPDLVGELVESAVLPVIENRLAASKALDKPQGGTQHQQKALLSIRVIDPACGSGHMLLAASRRIGKELARLRTGEEEPAPERIREAVRDVISHCVYGVDKNPLAVDLCRVALWLESHTTGKPLTFLDHRIRCGDALVGVFNLNALSEGIPDGAFKPLEGDDKETAREYAKRNRDEQRGERTMSFSTDGILQPLTRQSRRVDEIPDDSPELIRRKKQLFDAGRSDSQWLQQNQACDLWTSAFFQPLRPSSPVITTGAVFDSLEGRRNHQLDGLAMSLSHRHRFFHWPLEFPEVFETGGFDVVLSNPPWEHVELKEKEFFVSRRPDVATARTSADRARKIKSLRKEAPALYEEYTNALRSQDAARQFLSGSGRYPLCGRGRINTYAVFAETCRGLLNPRGRAGLVLPSGIATDDTTKFFFQDVMRQGSLASLYDFENRKKIFPAIDSRMKFCLFTLRGTEDGARDKATQFVFFALATEDLRKTEKRFTLTPEEIALLNPNTGNCPIFRTRADAELTKAIYRRVPVLWKEASEGRPEENPWNLSFSQGLFNMASDSHHFRTAKELEKEGYRLEGNIFVSNYDRYLPLYEAKMLHQFDHRWATYDDAETSREVTESEKQDPSFVVQPRYWVREEVVESVAPQYPEPVAMALQRGHRQSLQRLLLYWLAGYHLSRGEEKLADDVFMKAIRYDLDAKVTKHLPPGEAREQAAGLQQMFPLTEADAKAILAQIDRPDDLARSLVKRHSPNWFMGWRDICRSTDERTLIASALPWTAVGNNFPLIVSPALRGPVALCFLSNLDALVADYVARQKIGGTHINYFYLRQFPILPPSFFSQKVLWRSDLKNLTEWATPLVTELYHTSQDMTPVARDCGYEGPPFRWDPERRFQIRCELDAAFFHLYLGTAEEWQKEPAALKQHFPTPRDAVTYILETFPIVREKDTKRYGTYRTKDRILEIYDAMAEAMRTGRPYQTALDPPPGRQPAT
jgi:hypothetical protein